MARCTAAASFVTADRRACSQLSVKRRVFDTAGIEGQWDTMLARS